MSVMRLSDPAARDVNAPVEAPADKTCAVPPGAATEEQIRDLPAGGTDKMTNAHASPQIAWPQPAPAADPHSTTPAAHKPMRLK
jgi:hypothetical protein